MVQLMIGSFLKREYAMNPMNPWFSVVLAGALLAGLYTYLLWWGVPSALKAWRECRAYRRAYGPFDKEALLADMGKEFLRLERRADLMVGLPITITAMVALVAFMLLYPSLKF